MINNKIQSLYDLFTQQLLKNPDSKFLFDKINSKWRGLTLSEINNKVKSIQFYLKKTVCCQLLRFVLWGHLSIVYGVNIIVSIITVGFHKKSHCQYCYVHTVWS